MARRHEVFEVLKDYKRKFKGDGPSYRGLLAELRQRGYKMSLSTLREHIRRLEEEGLIENRETYHGKLIVHRSIWLEDDSEIPSERTAV